jgi:nucleoside-diphosphate-sugar epimerase
LPQDDPRQRRPDISKAHEFLNWAPRTSVKVGLKQTIAYFEEMLRDETLRVQLGGTEIAPS